MLSVAHLFARMYGRVPPDGKYSACLCLDTDGKRLRVEVFGADVTMYQCYFEEHEVEPMRMTGHGLLSWQGFFELIQKAFAESTLDFSPSTLQLKVTLKHERQNDVVPYPAFTSAIRVTLEPITDATTIEEALWSLSDNMASYVALRSGDKKESDRIAEICKSEGNLKVEAEYLRTEVTVLKEELECMNREIQYAAAREKELKALAATKGLNPAELDAVLHTALQDPTVLDLVCCRIPDPFKALLQKMPAGSAYSQRTTKVYDADLLRLIKTEPCLMYGVNAASHTCDVLQPMTADDISERRLDAILGCEGPRRAVWDTLSRLGKDLDFDVFDLQLQCDLACQDGNAPSPMRAGALFVVAYTVLYRTGAAFHLNMSEQRLLQLLSAVEACYEASRARFHTGLYAADVLQAVKYMSLNLSPKRATLRPLDVVCATLASIAVKLNHDGLDNDFHIRSRSALATAFGNTSPTESMHAASFLELIKLPRYDIFGFTSRDTRVEVCRRTAHVIRMTDPKNLELLLSAFSLRMMDEKELTETEDRDLLLSMLVCAGCEAFTIRHASVYRQWCDRLTKEMEMQGLEEERVLPPTAGCSPLRGRRVAANPTDRARLHIYRINFAALPLFASIADVVPVVTSIGPHLAASRHLWDH